jgi:hypothetical protein
MLAAFYSNENNVILPISTCNVALIEGIAKTTLLSESINYQAVSKLRISSEMCRKTIII